MLTRVCSALVWLPLLLSIACQSTASQDQYTLIDDMEPRPSGAWFSSKAGFSGLWYSSTQCGQGDNVSPPAYLGGTNLWTFDSLEQPYVTLQLSSHAARLKTTKGGLVSSPMDGPNSRNWGANMGVDLVTPPDPDGGAEAGVDAGTGNAGCPSLVSNRPYPDGVDLSSYSGLVFWAKASSRVEDGSLGEQTIHVMVHDRNSEPRGGKCNDNAKGYECYNASSKTLTLSESFERYEVDFSKLERDPTWGNAATDSLDLEHVYMFVFEVRQPKCVVDGKARCAGDASQVLKFDFSIDDLYLVEHPTTRRPDGAL